MQQHYFRCTTLTHFTTSFIWHTQSATALSEDRTMCNIVNITEWHFPHLPPLFTVNIQNPGIFQYSQGSVHSPSDQQLRVLLAIVQTASSMVTPLLWPRCSFWLLEFAPVLQWVDSYQFMTNLQRPTFLSIHRYCTSFLLPFTHTMTCEPDWSQRFDWWALLWILISSARPSPWVEERVNRKI